MKSFGLCNLNKNGSPGTRALKSTLPLGCQKLTSSNGASEERYENQSLSVMATKKRTRRWSAAKRILSEFREKLDMKSQWNDRNKKGGSEFTYRNWCSIGGPA